MRSPVASGFAILALFGSSAASAADPFWAQTTFLKGSPQVVLSGSEAPSPLQRGAVLHRNDRVIVPEQGQASFLLHTGAVLVLRGPADKVMGFTSPQGPAPDLTSVAQNLAKTLLSREGDNPMLKHLGGLRGNEVNLALAPCRTKVLPGAVRLRWSPKPGVKKYAVALMGPDDAVVEGETAETSWAPPRTLSGATYYWEVQDAFSRDVLTTLGSGSFTVLDEKAAAKVRKLLAAVEAAFPSPATQEDDTPNFLKYQVYRQAGLNADALGCLVTLLARSPEDAELLRLQKALLSEMGLREGDEVRLHPTDSP